MESRILEEAWTALLKLPLCDRCLGRLFARLGTELNNKVRGISLKTLIAMEIHDRVKRGIMKPEEAVEIAANMSYKPLTQLLRGYGLEVEERNCTVCRGELDRLIDELSRKAVEALRGYEVKNFVVGVTASPDIVRREEELLRTLKVETYESLKNEVKREVGKRIARATGLQPEFEKPELTVHIFLETGRVEIKPAPLYIMGRYLKTGRRISQAKWTCRGCDKSQYPISIEESLAPICGIYGGNEIKLHAAGREDVDARMLGTGRPAIVEIKNPRRRKLDCKAIEEAVKKASRGLVVFTPEKLVDARAVRELKEGAKRHKKIYRALVMTEYPVDPDAVRDAEEKLREVLIQQKTPLRVVHRRVERVREKRVYDLKIRMIEDQLLEVLLECEGGLYVKELISGDLGRTRPSLSEVLGVPAECIELDVLAVST